MSSNASATRLVSLRGVPIGIVIFKVTESSRPLGIMLIFNVGMREIETTRRQTAITIVGSLFSRATLRITL